MRLQILNQGRLLYRNIQPIGEIGEEHFHFLSVAINLRRVNEYIRDARNIAAADPNDEEARRSLMEAYQEKAMLFELALDRSLQ